MLGRAESTIKSKLMVLRNWHIAIGAGDPLAGKACVRVCLAGIKRQQLLTVALLRLPRRALVLALSGEQTSKIVPT